MFNEELGDPFIIIHSISLLNAEEHSIATLLLRIEKEELDMKGSGFYVSLEWVTISKKNKGKTKSESLSTGCHYLVDFETQNCPCKCCLLFLGHCVTILAPATTGGMNMYR